MKKQNFYLPVLTESGNHVNIKADKFKFIVDNLPSDKDILEHLEAQKELLQKGKPFHSIKVNIKTPTYQKLIKDIKNIVPSMKDEGNLDLIYSMFKFPVIQIVEDKY